MAKKQYLSQHELQEAKDFLLNCWETYAWSFQALPHRMRRAMDPWVYRFYESKSRPQAASYLEQLSGRELKILCREAAGLGKRLGL